MSVARKAGKGQPPPHPTRRKDAPAPPPAPEEDDAREQIAALLAELLSDRAERDHETIPRKGEGRTPAS